MRLGWMLVATGFALMAQPMPRVQFVEVEPGVKLEVLDWGGTGRPVILLAGYLTGHAFEPLAQQLTPFCHVYSITRRGLGASSRPDHGYSGQQSAKDVLKVVDSLGLDAKPVFAGHSFGAQDLDVLGSKYPDRVAGLVYINSAEDSTLGLDDYGVKPPDGKALPARLPVEKTDMSSIAGYRAWQMRVHGIRFPESELRQLYAVNPDGSLGAYQVERRVQQQMFQGLAKPEYAKIRVPVLAFFAGPASLEEELAKFVEPNEAQRAALEQQFAFDEAIRKRHIQDLKQGVPQAQVIEIAKGNFYLFLSHPVLTAAGIRHFLSAL